MYKTHRNSVIQHSVENGSFSNRLYDPDKPGTGFVTVAWGWTAQPAYPRFDRAFLQP